MAMLFCCLSKRAFSSFQFLAYMNFSQGTFWNFLSYFPCRSLLISKTYICLYKKLEYIDIVPLTVREGLVKAWADCPAKNASFFDVLPKPCQVKAVFNIPSEYARLGFRQYNKILYRFYLYKILDFRLKGIFGLDFCSTVYRWKPYICRLLCSILLQCHQINMAVLFC